MLAPEVWAFDPPSNTLKIQEGLIDSPEEVVNIIKSHPFNHLVSVILPDTPQVPQSILESLSSDNEYYKIDGLNASELVEKEFIDAFVKKGHLSAVSVGGHLDLDNCISLAGQHLVLSLNKDSYQELGLEGKAILSKSKDNQRYIVSIDLSASHFIPGKRNYERTYDCLKNHLQSFNIILIWEPDDERVCPSSVASFLCARGLNVQVCRPKFSQRRDFNVAVPQLYPPDKACELEEMMEWLGSFSLDVPSTVTPETEFLSTYSNPEDTISCGQVALLSWRGFFTISQVVRLFKALSKYFLERDEVPWVSLYVQGFADIPHGWNHRPHVFFTDGDNSFTVILKPRNAFLLATHNSNNKMIK